MKKIRYPKNRFVHNISLFGKSLHLSVRQFDGQQWSPVTRLLACLGLNVNVSVRSMTARYDWWRSVGSSWTTMTSPTTIYLDRDKSSRTNTSNCPSRVRLTKKRNYLPSPGPRGKIKDARFGAARATLLARSRSTIERYPRRCPFTMNLLAYTRHRETYTQLEAECTYIFTITPRSL